MNKLKRPHGESLARAPAEARWQPAEKEQPDEREHYHHPRPQRSSFNLPPPPTRGGMRGGARGRGGGGRGQPSFRGAMPVVAAPTTPHQAVPGPAQQQKKKKKAAKKKPTQAVVPASNAFDQIAPQKTLYVLNDDFEKKRPDRLTCTFASVHGFKYRKYTTAPKVVKPIELLQIYSDRQAQALQDMLEELALIEAEAQSREKGKEKLDPSDRGHHAVGDGSDDDDEGDADMQEVVKELVMDLEALNSGKAVQLEPEFDAPASHFFVAADHMPRNSGHAAKPVFFEAVENNTADGGDFKVADQPHAQGSLFWDTSAASNKQPHPKQQALSFGPARPDIFFKPSAGAKPSPKSQQQATSTNGMEDEDVRELCELERLLRDGFITREQHRERAAQLKEAIRVRKALAKQRKAERKREQEAEEKLWEERDRKLMLERREEEMKLKEQKKKELTRAVLQDFLEGRLSPKELAGQIKKGVVTVEQLLGLWKTELRPLRLEDYYTQPSAVATTPLGPSKHSKIMTDVMYLLQMSDPTKQFGNTIQPAALPQTPEVLHKVEKIAAHNPGLVRKFAHYIHTEREMRTEWQRNVQERLQLAV